MPTAAPKQSGNRAAHLPGLLTENHLSSSAAARTNLDHGCRRQNARQIGNLSPNLLAVMAQDREDGLIVFWE